MNRLFSLLPVVLFFSCQNGQQKVENQEAKIEWVDPNSIQQSQILHDSLTTSQINNIEYLYNTFKEVDPTSQEKWIEDFKRDQDPDREIEIWMMMAKAYKSYCQKREINLDVKKEVLKVLLMRSSVPEDEVLTHLKLEHLAEKEALKIMHVYDLESKPIRVIK